MRIVFISNYFNQHQKPVCDVLSAEPEVDFIFIATTKMGDFRKKLGYQTLKEEYVKSLVDGDITHDECKRLIIDCDVLMCGGADPKLIRDRQKLNKPILILSERLFKDGRAWKNILRAIKYNYLHFYRKSEYLLCSSAFAAADYNRCGLFRGRTYKWGYFPECIQYKNTEELISHKKHASIVWVGRLIGWKHPEGVICMAKKLRDAGYDFSVELIGTGELEDELNKKVKELDLEENVTFTGAMPPEEVRKHMEKAEIFVFTSDANEGWGAVLNEAMNSACVPVASHAIGSVPYMIDDGKNGYIFNSEDWDDLYAKVKALLDNHTERTTIAVRSYKTVTNVWNAEVAAGRLLDAMHQLLEKGKMVIDHESGPMSQAAIVYDDWYLKV